MDAPHGTPVRPPGAARWETTPLGLQVLGLAHILGGAVLAVSLTGSFAYLVAVGVKRGAAVLSGLPLDWVVVIVFGLSAGVGVGVGILRRRGAAWLACTSLYAVASAFAVPFWLFPAPAPLEGLAPVESRFRESIQVLLASPVGLVCGLLALAGYVYLSLPQVRTVFGVERRSMRTVVALHLSLFAVVAVSTVSLTRVSVAGAQRLRIEQIGARRVASEEDVGFLLDRLERGGSTQRMLAAWALGQTGRTDAAPRLLESARSDPSDDVRASAVGAIAMLADPDSVASLLPFLGDASEQVRSAALGGVVGLRHPELVERLGALVEDPRADLRAPAVDLLGASGDPGATVFLERAASDPVPDVRSRAAFALGKLGQPGSVPTLVRMLADEVWEVRANAAQALGMIGDPSARPALEKLLDDPHEIVGQTASTALDRL